jgi:hypothetical protein
MNSIQLANSAKLNHMKTAIQSYSPTKLKFYFPANCLHTQLELVCARKRNWSFNHCNWTESQCYLQIFTVIEARKIKSKESWCFSICTQLRHSKVPKNPHQLQFTLFIQIGTAIFREPLEQLCWWRECPLQQASIQIDYDTTCIQNMCQKQNKIWQEAARIPC